MKRRGGDVRQQNQRAACSIRVGLETSTPPALSDTVRPRCGPSRLTPSLSQGTLIHYALGCARAAPATWAGLAITGLLLRQRALGRSRGEDASHAGRGRRAPRRGGPRRASAAAARCRTATPSPWWAGRVCLVCEREWRRTSVCVFGVCVRACVRACVSACVRACVR